MPKAKAKTGSKRLKTRSGRSEYSGPSGSSGVQSLGQDQDDSSGPKEDFISQLSLELLEKIFDFLPIQATATCECLNRHFQLAVLSYMKVVKVIDLTEHDRYGWHGFLPRGFTLASLSKILRQCPKLEVIRGLHLHADWTLLCYHVESEQFVRGIVRELKRCRHLRHVEVSNIELACAILKQMPKLDLGHFANRKEVFESYCRPEFALVSDFRISKLQLTGVVLDSLPSTPHLQELFLEWVDLYSFSPFQNFVCPALKTFVMRNCFKPQNALKYVPLINNLAKCLELERLELVRVPFLGGLIQHKVEETAQEQSQAFSRLKTLLISGCKNCTEQDLGYLLLAAARSLESLSLQPCLTKDSLFLSLKAIEAKAHKLRLLHLGYVDPWANSGRYSPTELASRGLAEVTENPALLTDMGMKAMGQVFPNLHSITVYNCPHLRYPRAWLDVEPVDTNWSQLTSLHLHHCHGVQLSDSQSLSWFIEWLPSLEDIHLERMFPKPPKGCSRVGLSAGTGIGVSSALVAMQNPGAQHQQNPQNQAEVQVPEVAPIHQGALRHLQDQGDRGPHEQGQENLPPAAEAALRNVLEQRRRLRGQVIGVPGGRRGGQDQAGGDRQEEERPGNAARGALPAARRAESGPSREAGASPRRDTGATPQRPKPCPVHGYKRMGKDSKPSAGQVAAGEKQGKSSDPPVAMDVDRVDQSSNCDFRTIPDKSQSSVSEGGEEKMDAQDGDQGTKDKGDSDAQGSSCASSGIVPGSEEGSKGPSRPSVRDASTSAVVGRKTCPIHGPAMQVLDDPRDVSNSRSKGRSRPAGSPAHHSDPAAQQAANCQSVGVQVQRGAHSPPPESRPTMVDQATSTSDPVMESDPVLVFRCHSQSLRCATFDECGISHIDIQECPNLKAIQGHNMPIFKQLRLTGKGGCNVTRLELEQCVKSQSVDILQELMGCHPADRFIRLRPMSQAAVEDIEDLVVHNLPPMTCHLLLVVDGASPPQAHHSTALWDWVNLLSALNRDVMPGQPVRAADSASGSEQDESLDRSPLVRMSREQERLTLLTDIPWLKPLVNDGSFQLGKQPEFGKGKAEGISKLTNHLRDTITMATRRQARLFSHIFCVYVQTSDIDGTAVPGEFNSELS